MRMIAITLTAVIAACGDDTIISSAPTTVEIAPEEQTDTTCRGPECCKEGPQWDPGLGRCVNGDIYELPRIDFIRWLDDYTAGWSGAIGAFRVDAASSAVRFYNITIERISGASNMPLHNLFVAGSDGVALSDPIPSNETNVVQIQFDYTVRAREYFMIYIMAELPDQVIAEDYEFSVVMEGMIQDASPRLIRASTNFTLPIR